MLGAARMQTICMQRLWARGILYEATPNGSLEAWASRVESGILANPPSLTTTLTCTERSFSCVCMTSTRSPQCFTSFAIFSRGAALPTAGLAARLLADLPRLGLDSERWLAVSSEPITSMSARCTSVECSVFMRTTVGRSASTNCEESKWKGK